MACRRPSKKPLSEPVWWLVCRRINASLGLNELKKTVQFSLPWDDMTHAWRHCNEGIEHNGVESAQAIQNR